VGVEVHGPNGFLRSRRHPAGCDARSSPCAGGQPPPARRSVVRPSQLPVVLERSWGGRCASTAAGHADSSRAVSHRIFRLSCRGCQEGCRFSLTLWQLWVEKLILSFFIFLPWICHKWYLFEAAANSNGNQSGTSRVRGDPALSSVQSGDLSGTASNRRSMAVLVPPSRSLEPGGLPGIQVAGIGPESKGSTLALQHDPIRRRFHPRHSSDTICV